MKLILEINIDSLTNEQRDALVYLIGKNRYEVTKSEKILARPIDELELSVRSSNVLRVHNIHSIGDLVKLNMIDLIKMANMGERSANEIVSVLANHNLELKKL